MKKLANFILSALLALGLCLWLAKSLDTDKLLQTLQDTSLGWFSIALGLMALYQLIRGLRVRLFFPGRKGAVLDYFGLTCVQGFLNNLLPSWLGDAAMVYLLKRFHGMGIHMGAASVLTMRIADLGFILIMFIFMTVLMIGKAGGTLLAITVMMAVVVGAAVAAVAMMARYGAAERPEGKLAIFIHGHFEKLGGALETIREDKALLAPLILYTAAMWLIQYLVFTTLVWSLGYDLSMFTMLGVYLIGFSENLLPIKGVASLGTYETAWYIALRIFGMDKGTAVLLGFGSHALMFLIMALLAGPGLLIMAYGGKMAAGGGDNEKS